jgi:hypothetical protein
LRGEHVGEFFRESLKFGPDNHLLHDMHSCTGRSVDPDRDDGDRLPRRLPVLHSAGPTCRRRSPSSRSRSTSSCSTSGTSTSSTT